MHLLLCLFCDTTLCQLSGKSTYTLLYCPERVHTLCCIVWKEYIHSVVLSRKSTYTLLYCPERVHTLCCIVRKEYIHSVVLSGKSTYTLLYCQERVHTLCCIVRKEYIHSVTVTKLRAEDPKVLNVLFKIIGKVSLLKCLLHFYNRKLTCSSHFNNRVLGFWMQCYSCFRFS